MSSYRKLARKQAFRLGLAVTAMVGGMTGWHTAAYAGGATDIQKMDAANAGTITTSNNVWTVVPDKVEGDLATNAFATFVLNQNNVANLQIRAERLQTRSSTWCRATSTSAGRSTC